ncbi:MAG: hypothetical protein K2M78_04010 [Lachnospiraceae bacterium]|nr:hypothetical protein [Lachnospiraceae bacterium]
MIKKEKSDIEVYITGRGTVVVGTIESGSISVGEEVIIRRNDGTVQKSVIGGIELFRKVSDKAFKGDNVGILLNGIKRQNIGVGDVIQK